jgi:hypothetical protein
MRAPLIAVLLFAAPAFAQGTPPDLVRTRDGGMMRGTIIEKVPGEHVEIQLPNGQTRTVPMSEVEYAGPATTETTPASSARPANAATIDVPLVKLDLRSAQRGVTYHRKASAGYGVGAGWVGGKNGGPVSLAFASASFERLCTAPCLAELPQGTYSLGLSLGDGGVVAAEGLDLRGHLRVDGTYTSNANTRRAGVAVTMLSLGLGAALAFYSTTPCNLNQTGSDCSKKHPYWIHGLVVGGLGSTLGLMLSFVGDDVSIRATPVR